jgi:type II secretory ATPase GspE/PulE/Tfp pilus assembly ATPase PilB-like protein
MVPQLVREVLIDAFKKAASDIHFEPRPKHVIVRFRIDGVLQEQCVLPKDFYANVLNLIKVDGGLRIDEHQAAQDGSLRSEWLGRFIDLRVSVVPVVDGEKVVMRVLSSYVADLGLHYLGLSSADRETLESVARKPFGMMLVSGPTGSGKTTTLYGLLKLVNQTTVNVTTIEDPVEYKLLGVNQIQVNNQTGLTFAKGLRSIVRQDPDVILVGEIRDRETAEIAVNAALTGHMLLSTFHANDAATAIPRLMDMGIEPFLLASTLEVIVSQRLARRLCDHCRYSYSLEGAERRKKLGPAEKYLPTGLVTLYASKGCAACHETGFHGRVALFEIIRATPELRDLVLKRPSSQDIWRLAQKQGARSLFDDGIVKVLEGVTTLEELLRVATPTYVGE